jgi:hypothetical protein
MSGCCFDPGRAGLRLKFYSAHQDDKVRLFHKADFATGKA